MIENTVIRHSNEIQNLKRTVSKTGRVAANLQFVQELPDPKLTTTKLVYLIPEDTLYKNAGFEWQGITEHIVSYQVQRGKVILPNITGNNIRILKIFSPELPETIIIHNTTEILPENIDLFLFEEEEIKLEIDLPHNRVITFKYIEVANYGE